jgi:hypothetical protein
VKKGVRPPRIITTDEWGARRPRGRIRTVRRPHRILFHHTAGHHRDIVNPINESIAELKRYARDIQAFHMGPSRGWLDSGHNYLVGRNGYVCVGRHHSFTANRAGVHVLSAHCPGQNDQIGIEHENLHEQEMTVEQFEASARLHAWLMSRCGIRVSEVYPHRRFFPTSCPEHLADDIARIKVRAAQILNHEGRAPARRVAGMAFRARQR